MIKYSQKLLKNYKKNIIYLGVMVSNAERDGIIILILMLISIFSQKKMRKFFLNPMIYMEINGQKYQEKFKGDLII